MEFILYKLQIMIYYKIQIYTQIDYIQIQF